MGGVAEFAPHAVGEFDRLPRPLRERVGALPLIFSFQQLILQSAIAARREITIRLTYMCVHHLELNSTMQSTNKYTVQVIDRALAILEVLADDGPALTLAELAGRIRLPKSTVLRLLNVLQQHRLVARDSRSGNYRLGLKLMELGTSAASQLDFVERARPHLNRLMATTGETVFLSVLDGTDALVVDRVESARTIRVPLSAGGRAPAYCTANGKALLAFLPEAEIDARLARAKLRSYTHNRSLRFLACAMNSAVSVRWVTR